MKLYIDLNKAVNVPNMGQSTQGEEQSTRAHRNSYGKQPVGVMGGGSQADDPDEGGDWNHPEEEDEEKSLDAAKDVIKSLRGRLSEDIRRYKPMSSEQQYLIEVLGYSESDVMKGLAKIGPVQCQGFHDWLCDRMKKSVDRLK